MVKAHLINSLLSQSPPRGLLKFSKSWHWELTCKGFHLCSDFHNSLLELLLLLQGLSEFFQRSLGIKASLHLQGQNDTYREKGNNEFRILTFSRRTSHSRWEHTYFCGLPLWMNSATFLKSSCTKPLEVRAGEPNLKPLGRKALLSPSETHVWQHSKVKIWSLALINASKKESVQTDGRQRLRLRETNKSKATRTRYQGRCSYYRQWHRLPEPSLLGLHRFLCFAGPARSDGCQNPLKKSR